MTALVSPRLQGAKSRRESQLSLGRAFWLLAGLRLTRWRRRLRGLWRTPADALKGSRRVSSPAAGSLGLLLWLGLMLGTYCLQSFQALAGLMRQLGPESLPRHAAVLSSLQVLCLVSFSLTGEGTHAS
jgi:hypothetical protein